MLTKEQISSLIDLLRGDNAPQYVAAQFDDDRLEIYAAEVNASEEIPCCIASIRMNRGYRAECWLYSDGSYGIAVIEADEEIYSAAYKADDLASGIVKTWEAYNDVRSEKIKLAM